MDLPEEIKALAEEHGWNVGDHVNQFGVTVSRIYYCPIEESEEVNDKDTGEGAFSEIGFIGDHYAWRRLKSTSTQKFLGGKWVWNHE